MSAAYVVVMGVAGCGKSSLGRALAARLAVPFVEGDGFHPPSNLAKMRSGVPLDDVDRAGWLDLLAHQLAAHEAGVVLACSALKRAYRERLRAARPGLHFVHLVLTPQEAGARTAARHGHFYPPTLVASQFATLEDPAGEAGVLPVDATRPLAELAAEAAAWVRASPFTNA